jgi:multiple sugar transport system permease protein
MTQKLLERKEKLPKEPRERLGGGGWKDLNAKLLDFLHSLCFIGPSFFGVLLFFIIPFGVVVYYSLIKSPLDPEFAGITNFINLFKNSAFRMAARNTLVFAAVSVPLAVVMALCHALLLEARIPLKSQFRTFFLSPMMVPVASIVLIWQVIFHANGALNEVLSVFGMKAVDWFKSDYSLVVVLTLFLWKNLGYNMILFMAALSNIPKELLEVADVEGAGPVYKFFAIKLRYLSPTVLFVTILSLINSFKVFREVYLLTGDYPYETLYMLQHFMNNTFKSLDYQKLSAAAVVMALVMVIIIAVLFKVEDWFGKDVEG